MDDNGETFSSIRYISEVTGVALNAAGTAIKELLELIMVSIITRKIECT